VPSGFAMTHGSLLKKDPDKTRQRAHFISRPS